MTLRPEDFVIEWPNGSPLGDKPATYTEIISALEALKESARIAPPGRVVELTLRTPVAKAVASGINSVNPGTAVIDIGQDPMFSPEKGGYQSRISIAQTRERMSEYIDSY